MDAMKGMTIMATGIETSACAERDRIVRRLDEFPELTKALRNGDVPTGRYLCAQLFNLDACSAVTLALSAKAS
jgi:hypothetical protein